ncbi:MAG: KpsF/GutQ family sugar-phosphate isomerase, partial [Armatimonadetes bacterium]|nr:KpsF/GutQ family sugar-phosphate isomerase [Armatimonadota bacterium]NIO57220.1 KpsF/GutQ family sugar-phosphate isomerase [Candidatus Latescibacterota bacterium]NIM24511.1 KpsF/GutQ family sugar-phosphate isomerase [Armatimonadota bacterium]NIM68387.1 KpsF/GutQ family sugar-phosphate isomerase [Armatimonadota bacterium]NIM76773.1 KpsF/GutQ family sugar-phosphate isomerase [Armatimonadota bacterium]
MTQTEADFLRLAKEALDTEAQAVSALKTRLDSQFVRAV